jgi:hypothetical protein
MMRRIRPWQIGLVLVAVAITAALLPIYDRYHAAQYQRRVADGYVHMLRANVNRFEDSLVLAENYYANLIPETPVDFTKPELSHCQSAPFWLIRYEQCKLQIEQLTGKPFQEDPIVTQARENVVALRSKHGLPPYRQDLRFFGNTIGTSNGQLM